MKVKQKKTTSVRKTRTKINKPAKALKKTVVKRSRKRK